MSGSRSDMNLAPTARSDSRLRGKTLPILLFGYFAHSVGSLTLNLPSGCNAMNLKSSDSPRGTKIWIYSEYEI